MALMKSKDDQGEMTEEAHAEWLDLQAKAWADRMAKTYGNIGITNASLASASSRTVKAPLVPGSTTGARQELLQPRLALAHLGLASLQQALDFLLAGRP